MSGRPRGATMDGRKKELARKAAKPPSQVKRDRDGLTRCRVCGCTEVDACADGCSWVDGTDLCSTCGRAVDELAWWMAHSRRVNKAALWREAERAFGDTPVPYECVGLEVGR